MMATKVDDATEAQRGNSYSKVEEVGPYFSLEDPREVGIPPQMFKDEVAAIRDRRKKEVLEELEVPKDGKPSAALGLKGLCISGGGIRSATFSTGVMQALAAEDVLKHMDYLSTVSGGGYSGSSLTWALYGKVYDEDDEIKSFIKSFGTGPESFPTGTDDPAEPRKESTDKNYGFRLKLLNYLREHGNYLTPGGGITALSSVAVLLRGIALNLIVWVGLVASLILLALQADPSGIDWPAWLPYAWLGGWGVVIIICGLAGKRFPIPLVAFALVGAAFIVTVSEADSGEGLFRRIEPTILLALTGVVASLIYGVFTFFAWGHGSTRRYGYRRYVEHAANPYFIVTILAVTIGTLGFVHGWLEDLVEATSLAMVASGIASGFWTFSKSSSDKDEESKIPIGLVATVGSLLLLYGGLLGAYALAAWASDAGHGEYAWWAFAGVLVLGVLVNTNYISLGRYYRDRLMETFMPPIERALKDETGGAEGADATGLSEMWANGDEARGPYHIVNTNLVLVDSKRRTWRTRGGDSFILSPFYCGSTATGWRRTEKFERDTMTLSTAMAISAAAANPNAGVGGKGLTRSKFVSLLMALLNLRLGSWVRNCEAPRRVPPNHFWPGGAYELLGGFKETSNWLMLSDGGHFENLALYEMIRRRLKLIVVLDGGADPNFNFADLQNAIRRIGTDFGARLVFSVPKASHRPSNEHPLRFLSYKRLRDAGHFPLYPGRADRGWVHAKIKYQGWTEGADNSKFEGDLIYIKTTLVRGLGVTTEGYRDAHPSFPDQSTADQFFDAEQFEAYRDLGYRIGMEAAEEVKKHV